MALCAWCDGMGEDLDAYDGVCDQCGGSGEIGEDEDDLGPLEDDE